MNCNPVLSRSALAGAATLLTYLTIATLQAQVLPPAQWTGSFTSYVSQLNASGQGTEVNYTVGPLAPISGSSITTAATGAAGETLSASFIGNSSFVPSLQAAINVSVPQTNTLNHLAGGTINATFNYSFVVDSTGGAGQDVFIRINASGNVDTSLPGTPIFSSVKPNSTHVRSSLDILSQSGSRVLLGQNYIDNQSPNFGSSSYSPITQDATGYHSGFLFAGDYILKTGLIYNVSMNTSVDSGTMSFYGGGTYSAFAFVDPQLTISTLNANPQQYTIRYSEGIGAIPQGVPDSGTTIAMLGAVLVGCIAVRCRIS